MKMVFQNFLLQFVLALSKLTSIGMSTLDVADNVFRKATESCFNHFIVAFFDVFVVLGVADIVAIDGLQRIFISIQIVLIIYATISEIKIVLI